jgi:hypothetical protein
MIKFKGRKDSGDLDIDRRLLETEMNIRAIRCEDIDQIGHNG